jgi:hypothetical protein
MPHAIPKPISEAARAIVLLINQRPTSPRQDEIEAILAKVTSPSLYLQEEPTLALEIRRLHEKADEANERVGYHPPVSELRNACIDEHDRFMEQATRIAEAVWSAPPRSIADLYVRAEIARYWHQGEETRLEGEKPEECDDWGHRAIAELIHAVLQLVEAH